MFWFQEGLERLLHLLGNMEMPLGAYYTNTLPTAGLTPARGGHECIINFMRKSRAQNVPAFFSADTPAAAAGRRRTAERRTRRCPSAPFLRRWRRTAAGRRAI